MVIFLKLFLHFSVLEFLVLSTSLWLSVCTSIYPQIIVFDSLALALLLSKEIEGGHA